jgi:hypothetical protein
MLAVCYLICSMVYRVGEVEDIRQNSIKADEGFQG